MLEEMQRWMRGLEVGRNKSHSNRAPRESKVNIEARRQAL